MGSENQGVMRLDEVGKVSDPLLLGKRQEFVAKDYINADARAGIVPIMTDGKVVAILCRQSNATPRAKGEIVRWASDTTYGAGKAVDALCGDDEKGAGIVSPFIGNVTVAEGEFFWLIVKGITYVRYDGTAINAANTKLTTAADGEVRAYVAGTDEPTNFIGMNTVVKASGAAGDLFKALVNFEN